MKDIHTIAVHGLGYIGLPTACLFAQAGNKVIGIDINENRIKNLQSGILPFSEPGLDKLFNQVKENMVFSTVALPADVHIIAVPTPLDTERKKADLTMVYEAAISLSSILRDKDIVIIESTIPPKTCLSIEKMLREKTGKMIYVGHCPERAFTGKTLQEMVENNRIIGCEDEVKETLQILYQSFVKGKIWMTDALTAECTKLLENTYRDVNIAFANEFIRIAEQIGMNGWEVIEFANKHPRVSIMQPGIGVGGHCLPIDPWFLLENGVESEFIKLSRRLNDQTPYRIADIILKNTSPDTKIGILGVAYKKNVDDQRETPVNSIIHRLQENNRILKVTDPFVQKFWYELTDMEEVLQLSDCIVLATNHDIYSSIDFSQYSNIKTLIDCHNQFTSVPDVMKLIKIGTPNIS